MGNVFKIKKHTTSKRAKSNTQHGVCTFVRNFQYLTENRTKGAKQNLPREKVLTTSTQTDRKNENRCHDDGNGDEG